MYTEWLVTTGTIGLLLIVAAFALMARRLCRELTFKGRGWCARCLCMCDIRGVGFPFHRYPKSLFQLASHGALVQPQPGAEHGGGD